MDNKMWPRLFRIVLLSPITYEEMIDNVVFWCAKKKQMRRNWANLEIGKMREGRIVTIDEKQDRRENARKWEMGNGKWEKGKGKREKGKGKREKETMLMPTPFIKVFK